MSKSPIGGRSWSRVPAGWHAAAALAAWTLSPAAAIAGAPLTLDAYVERVLNEGLQARAAAAEVDVAAAELDATGLWPNPSVELSRQGNAVGVRAGESQDQLVVSLPLALSGRLGLLRDAAAKDVEAAQARLSFARSSLTYEATGAFLESLAARRRVAVEKRALELLEPVVAAVVAREKAGESAGYDRVRIELEKKRLEADLAAAVAAEARARASAAALLGPDGADFEPAKRDLSVALMLNKASLEGVAKRGDVRALAAEVEAAQLQEDASGRALIPEPTLFGGGYLLDLGRPELGYGYTVGVEVPIRLFDNGQGGRARATARRSLAEAEQRALLHAARARFAAAVADGRSRAEQARKHDEEIVVRANELLEITTAAYRGGGAELLALVDAERAQREASASSIDLHLSARRSENEALLLAGAYDDVAPSSTNP